MEMELLGGMDMHFVKVLTQNFHQVCTCYELKFHFHLLTYLYFRLICMSAL